MVVKRVVIGWSGPQSIPGEAPAMRESDTGSLTISPLAILQSNCASSVGCCTHSI